MRVGTEAFTHERDAGKALPRQSFMLQKDKREVSVSRGPTATTSTYKCSFQTRHLSVTAADAAASQAKEGLLSKAAPRAQDSQDLRPGKGGASH